MYFYVDESGHTGPNLFDPAQPTLFYGVLSATINVDVLAEPAVQQLRRTVGLERLHASEMGLRGLGQIAPGLLALQRRYDLCFDIYKVEKRDHAIIAYFDQVFDVGMNPAVAWHHYWTPMRYVLLLKLAHLFDEPLARDAWAARITRDSSEAERLVHNVCQRLIDRLPLIPDVRSREILLDGLAWAAANPSALSYNASDSASAKAIMPNVIGFQSVLLRVAERLRANGVRRVSITVDRQSQFNAAQQALTEMYRNARGNVSPMGPGMPVLDWRGMPEVPLRISGGTESVGLELTDSFLYIFSRIAKDQPIPENLRPLVGRFSRRTKTNEVSLRGLERRWGKWFQALPELKPEEVEKARQLMEFAEQRRLHAVANAAVTLGTSVRSNERVRGFGTND